MFVDGRADPSATLRGAMLFKISIVCMSLKNSGGADETRTRNLLRDRQML